MTKLVEDVITIFQDPIEKLKDNINDKITIFKSVTTNKKQQSSDILSSSDFKERELSYDEMFGEGEISNVLNNKHNRTLNLTFDASESTFTFGKTELTFGKNEPLKRRIKNMFSKTNDDMPDDILQMNTLKYEQNMTLNDLKKLDLEIDNIFSTFDKKHIKSKIIDSGIVTGGIVTGAIAGSIFGPLGTAIGAGIGVGSGVLMVVVKHLVK